MITWFFERLAIRQRAQHRTPVVLAKLRDTEARLDAAIEAQAETLDEVPRVENPVEKEYLHPPGHRKERTP